LPQPTLDFWFEFASTYSYPAAMRIGAEAKARGVAVRWRPFLLGPLFKANGWTTSPFNIYPAKGRYMWRDLQRICAALDLPFAEPPDFPQNTLLPARVALVASRRTGARIFAATSIARNSAMAALSVSRRLLPIF
jgi:2-hydroxychromene-2-carboxylate isomerase